VSKPPLLSLDERRAALAKAAQSRKIRAGFKNEIKNGKRDWRDAFSSSDEVILKMRVKELLLSIPGFGETRVHDVMERCGISSARRIQGVGRNQRENLFRVLSKK
jgi:hypothetical protein